MTDRGAVITRLEAARDLLADAVARVPHYIDASILLPLSGDEPHAADCPGCAVTNALVALQEALSDA